MAASDLTVIAGDLIDAFNQSDWARFKALLAPDIRYEETGTQRRLEGADAYVQLCQGWKNAFPDATGTIRNTAASNNTVAQELTWEATHTGPLESPTGTIPPSGKRALTQATVWLIFQGDKAQEIHHHLDVLSLLQQIGALPTPR